MLSTTSPFCPMVPTSTMTPPTTTTPHRPQGSPKQCSNCFVAETCQWRNVRSENGILCNACFIYQRKYKKTRPITAMEKYRSKKAHRQNCTQIQDTQVYEGNEIHIPGGNGIYNRYQLIFTVFIGRTGIGGDPYRYIVTPGREMMIEVVTKSLFMNTKMAISVYYRAYCKQLQISDGQTISIPGNSLQPIPANYSCTYVITAPTSPTTGLYANVTLISNMNGFQDKIIVTDITGANDWDPDINYYNYIVIPGSSMLFEIKTGDMFMASMFLIRVEWHEVNIGPTKPMIRDEINYVDLALLKDDTSVFNSVTFSANEQLVVSQVYYISVQIDFPNCFVIDGNITDQKRVFTFKNFNYTVYESESNYMTFVMFSKGMNAYVLNLLSVAKEVHHHLPANYNCTYQILPPVNYDTGLYAKVILKNGLRGANDLIIVTDVDGKTTTMNNRTGIGGFPFEYLVFPGAQFFIQVTTKSVLMNSMFSITVEYHNAPIGPTSTLKTGSEMNYFEMATIRDGRNVFSSRTFTDKDSIYMYVGRKDNRVITCWDCFVIDGTFMNQTRVFRLASVDYQVFNTKSNALTIIAFEDGSIPLVFNRYSEAQQYTAMFAYATTPVIPEYVDMKTFFSGFTEVLEVVNFNSTGIIMQDLVIRSDTCNAYVVDGPPNNSSKVIMDIANATMPKSFDLKYFSVINLDCDFVFGVKSYDN
ncbi:hypothetical protein GCK72_021513 [Caenorhabditis remanei]|uniref:GATA-type domain-containing protein n=1 Tax=Caenorhabditis remanei TaxID=31234 RepID=A0A6A5GID4_CAERE|nr:hypothetical protein GCK72_021513 [Caenorhabditis remanei]KAF1754948.1 hypothetical protein GCK72_021513 [Caenorhabditis remanei]